MKNNLLKIIEHYGINNQLRKFNEESFELQEAIINHGWTIMSFEELSEKTKEHIAEEIADCYVILEQFRHYYGISDEEIEKVMKYKIERQLDRINEEKEKLKSKEKIKKIAHKNYALFESMLVSSEIKNRVSNVQSYFKRKNIDGKEGNNNNESNR